MYWKWIIALGIIFELHYAWSLTPGQGYAWFWIPFTCLNILAGLCKFYAWFENQLDSFKYYAPIFRAIWSLVHHITIYGLSAWSASAFTPGFRVVTRRHFSYRERTLIKQWKTRRLWLLVSVLWHTCMHEQYDPGGPKHVWNWLHEKKGLSCARPRKNGMHIKTSHKFFCHNSNRNTNLASNFLSEETAWRNIIVFARTKNVATRLISLLFVKIPLKLFSPTNFHSVRWNIALHQTECPVKCFCLREVCDIEVDILSSPYS